MAPPAWAGSSSRWVARPSKANPKPAGHVPDRTDLAGGDQLGGLADQRIGTRIQTASIKNGRRARGQSDELSASAAVMVSGFSTSTALPAARQARAEAKMVVVDRRDIHDVDVRVGGELVGRPVRAGEAVLGRRNPRRARALRELTATSSASSGSSARSGANTEAICPVLSMPQRDAASCGDHHA